MRLLRIWVSFTHYTLLIKRDGGANTPFSAEMAAPFLRAPRLLTTRTPGPVASPQSLARQPCLSLMETLKRNWSKVKVDGVDFWLQRIFVRRSSRGVFAPCRHLEHG